MKRSVMVPSLIWVWPQTCSKVGLLRHHKAVVFRTVRFSGGGLLQGLLGVARELVSPLLIQSLTWGT